MELGPAQLRAGSAWALASVAMTLSSSVLRTFVMARFLEPVEIGLMGIALLALGFVEAVASTGVDTALTAGRDVEPYIDPGFTVQVVRGIAVFAVLCAAAPIVARIFDNGAAIGVVRTVATIAALRGLANPAVVLAVRRLDFRRMFWWALPEVSTTLFLSIVLGYLRRDVWALVIAVVAGQAVGTLASYGLVRRRPRLVFDRERILALLRFGRFVSGSRALMYFSVNVDAALVGVAMGTPALGLYQFATRVAELPVVTFTRAVAQVALPALSHVEIRADAARRVWRTMLGWVVAVNAAAAVVILLFGEAAVITVAGRKWLPAVPIMRILTVAMLFRAILVLTGQLLDAVGQPSRTLRLNAVRLCILVAALGPFAAWGGLRGIALAVLVANGIAAVHALRVSAAAQTALR
jgi:O-antigen/teichoic acid export membrane protein